MLIKTLPAWERFAVQWIQRSASASRGFVAAFAERPDPCGEREEDGGAADDRKTQQPRIVRAVEQRVDRQRNEQSERQYEDQKRADEPRIDGERVFRVGREVVDDLKQRPAARSIPSDFSAVA